MQQESCVKQQALEIRGLRHGELRDQLKGSPTIGFHVLSQKEILEQSTSKVSSKSEHDTSLHRLFVEK